VGKEASRNRSSTSDCAADECSFAVTEEWVDLARLDRNRDRILVNPSIRPTRY
jgi:hypothetical protein